MGDGRARAERRDRAPRCGRHGRNAASTPRGVRLGGYPKSFSIDGLKTNWGGGGGSATMQCYGFEMYDEYNMQTASGTAESDVSGVYMNMVTKSGGNRFTSDHNFYFMNDALQGRTSTTSCGRGSDCSRGRPPLRRATRSTSPTTGARRSAAR